MGLAKCPALVLFVICLGYHCTKAVLYLERRSMNQIDDYLACQVKEDNSSL